MITNFKIFESFDETELNFDLDELQSGDYILIKPHSIIGPIVSNIIGRVINVKWHYDEVYVDFGEKGKIHLGEDDLLYWSHTKEPLEFLLTTNKYNL